MIQCHAQDPTQKLKYPRIKQAISKFELPMHNWIKYVRTDQYSEKRAIFVIIYKYHVRLSSF